MAWEYAELAMRVKKCGGPDQYDEYLHETGKEEGRREMCPVVFAAAAIGSAITALVAKIHNSFKEKRNKKHQAIIVEKKKQLEELSEKYDGQEDYEDAKKSNLDN